MTGKDHYQIAGCITATLEVVAACTLLFAARSPAEVLACGVAAVLGFIALALWMED